MISFEIENSFEQNLVVGIDEAGRGPIAGPVVAACALIDQNKYPDDINDSKKISSKKRKEIYSKIKEEVKFGIGVIGEEVIDQINILQATKLAMKKAYEDLLQKYKIYPKIILVDGNFVPFENCDEVKEILPVIKGDQKSISIAAASIIAKEVRDEIMLQNHQQFPQYGFAKHMGYPTKFHVAQLEKFGISQIHRKTFAPVKLLLNAKN